MKSVFWLKGVCLFSLLALSSAWGQLNRGTITGIVTDPSGAAVAEAKITAVHLETNISSSTSSTMNGNYTLSSLPMFPSVAK